MSKCQECRMSVGHADDCPLVAPDVIVGLQDEVLSLTVERDNLRKMLEDANGREQALHDALLKVLRTGHTCENGYSGGPDCPGCKAIIDLGDFRPIPMSKIDPLEDIMPPVTEIEGSGGGC